MSPKILDPLLKRELFNMLPFGVVAIDREMRLVTANPYFEKRFGAWHGKRCHEVFKGLPEPCSNCQARLTFADGIPRISDETGLDRQGLNCYFIVHVAPLRGESGNVEYVVEMITDVTETRLRQREYNLLFERVPCFITVIDSQYKILRANERFRQTFGESTGKSCFQAYKNRSEPCQDCPAEQTFSDGLERVVTQTGIAKDGSETDYVVTTAPLRRGSGEVMHVIEISADITQVKRLEREMLEAERLAAVGQTVAGLAHTIKNLLMGLEGGMYMLDSGLRKGDAERLAEGWEVLQRNFEKTVVLVKDFLSFSKGRAPDLKLVNPNRLAREVVELYNDAAARQGVKLTVEAGPMVKRALLDRDGLEACLTNLVSNAIDAAMTRDDSGAQVIVRTREEGEALIFEVEDNGCGMDWEVRQKVFTTFFTTKSDRGTGLGLLTTRKIVQEHGGSMEVDSDPGTGSRFRIRLPRPRLKMVAEQIAREAKKSPSDIK
jgi:PAS domain S-box-containing protein